MMVNCPRCGFTQPKDQFCASCGIDILTFKQAEPTWAEKIKKSWLAQIAVLALVLITVFVAMRDRVGSGRDLDLTLSDEIEEESFRSAEDRARMGTQTASSLHAGAGSQNNVETGVETYGNEPPGTSVSSIESASAASSSTFADNSGGNEPGAGTNDKASAGGENENPSDASQPASSGGAMLRQADALLAESGASNRSDSAVTVQRLRVSFVAAPRAFYADLVNSVRSIASYESFSGGVVSDLSARIKVEKANRSYTELDTALEYPVRVNQPIIAFKGTRDEATEQNIGLTLQLTPVANDDQGVQLQVEVIRALRDTGTNSGGSGSFQETFLVPKESGVILAGALPRRVPEQDETRLYGGSPVLQVMNSSSFQNGASDFLILIEAR